MEKEKVCARCKLPKLLERDFHRDTAHPSGRQHWCRECSAAANRRRGIARRAEAARVAADLAAGAALAAQSGDVSPPAVVAVRPCARIRTRPRPQIHRGQYAAMLQAQHFGCAMCGQPERFLGADNQEQELVFYFAQRPGITIRMLLCHQCDYGVRFFRDSPQLLARASTILATGPDYLRELRTREARLTHVRDPEPGEDGERDA